MLPLHYGYIIKQDRFNIVLPLHQTFRLRSRTAPFLFKRSVLLIFAVTILKLVPPAGFEPTLTNYLLHTGYKSAVLPLNYRGIKITGCLLCDGLEAVALPLSDLRMKRGVGIEPTCHK
jgi:hypothetical protein